MGKNNEERLLAAQIVLNLYDAKDVAQLKLLKMQIDRSIEVLEING